MWLRAGFAFSFIGFVVKILAGNNQSSSISQGINARASKKLIWELLPPKLTPVLSLSPIHVKVFNL